MSFEEYRLALCRQAFAEKVIALCGFFSFLVCLFLFACFLIFVWIQICTFCVLLIFADFPKASKSCSFASRHFFMDHSIVIAGWLCLVIYGLLHIHGGLKGRCQKPRGLLPLTEQRLHLPLYTEHHFFPTNGEIVQLLLAPYYILSLFERFLYFLQYTLEYTQDLKVRGALFPLDLPVGILHI